MDTSSLELRHLRYFIAVAEELNFRRAAGRLRITPPGLSTQIKQLEEILGARLCERDTSRGVRLTIAGEHFLPVARQLIGDARRLMETTREAARGVRGRLCVGMPGRLSYSFFADALRQYAARYPDIEVCPADLDMEGEQQRAVEKGRLHLGFAYDFQLPHLKDMASLPVMDLPVCAAMGARHPLAKKERVSLRELARHPVLTLAGNASQGRHMAALFRQRNLAAQFKKTGTFDACMAALIAGKGVTLLPAMRILTLNPQLALRPIKDTSPADLPRMRVHAVWLKTGAPPQVLNFVERLREAGVQGT